MVRIDQFKEVLSSTQTDLKEMAKKHLTNKGYEITEDDGFLYGKGEVPIMLVAHLDIVHKRVPKQIFFDQEQLIIWSPTGIGGDDRCGVYAIMQLVNNGYKPHVLFLEDEEKGCIGAKKCVKKLARPDVKFLIEIDRRGKKDCVFYDCGNLDFQKYIENFGFKTAIGTYSDICKLSSAWEIASVNLSAGYYNEHTDKEYINIYHLSRTYNIIKKILEDDANNKTYFDYQEVRYAYNSNYWSNWNKKNKNEEEYTQFQKGHQYLCSYDGCTYYSDYYYDKQGKKHYYEEYDNYKDLN